MLDLLLYRDPFDLTGLIQTKYVGLQIKLMQTQSDTGWHQSQGILLPDIQIVHQNVL